MYLKRIEVFGFKSFAEKVDIQLDDSITAIVGPNGSGKSNVVDAIRWVLGEQRPKSLRGEKMEDVIFSGSNEKGPLGYASVTITLDNNDHTLASMRDEFTVSRKLYRSGDSEYYIDKTQVRLRDVQELFMDTGLGKEGYSIIGQGKIESVVNNSPAERKLMIEEAAGIVKYKTKKQQALRKLERVEANLVRIADITKEISSRLSTLKRQSEKAKTYLSLYDSLKEMQISVFAHEMEAYQQELSEKRSLNDTFCQTLSEVTAQIAAYDTRYIALKQSLSSLQQDSAQLETQRETISRQGEAAAGEIIALETKIEAYEEQLATLSKEAQQAKQEAIAQRALWPKLEERIAQAARVCEEKRAAYMKQKDVVTGLDAILKKESEAFEAVSVRLEAKKTAQQELADAVSAQQTQLVHSELLKNRLLQEIADLQTTVKELQRDDKVQQSLAAKQRYDTSLARLTQQEQTLQSLEQRVHALGKQEQNLFSEIKVLQGKVDILSESENNGYRFGVRKLLQATENSKAVYGAVGDVITVDTPYLQAVQKALGGMVEYILCENETAASTMIALLKKNRWGRVTFLPLNVVKGQRIQLSQDERTCPGFCAIASEVVHTQQRFGGVIENLLGKTIIVDTMANAIAFTRKTRNRYKVVTLDGEVFFPGGAMVGGKNKNEQEGVLTKKAQAEKMSAQLAQLKTQRQTLLDACAELEKERSEASAQLDLLAAETETLKIDFIEKQRDAGHFASRLQDLTSRLQQGEAQLSETNETMRKQKDSSIQLDAKLCAAKEELVQAQEEVQKISFGQNKDAYIKESTLLSTLQVDMLKAQEALRSVKNELSEEEEKVTLLENTVSLKEQNAEALRLQCIAMRERTQTLRVQNESFLKRREEMRKKSEQLIQRKESMNAEFIRINDAIKELSAQKNTLSEKQTTLIRRIEAVELSMQYLQRDMLDQYNVTYAEVKDSPVAIDDLQQRRDQISSLKEQIKALGHVNVDALQEYQEQSERHDQLSLQQEDLEKSKDELNGIIRDMNKKMQVQFLQQFNLIQTQFDSIFKSLFGGGEARLLLTDEDDLLETGVDIVACPPKAKLKNIAALSGGEKSMTAIALIFAIFTVKPAIFAILDEIDAALDDANLVRLCEYIHRIQNENQFIIITHRKRTMEVADTIYGATMNKSGATKLVSVKLSDVLE